MPLHYSLVGIELWVRAPLWPTGTKETHPHPAARKLMIPRDRCFWWYWGALLFLGPFGFVVGPPMARRASRKVAVLSGCQHVARLYDRAHSKVVFPSCFWTALRSFS